MCNTVDRKGVERMSRWGAGGAVSLQSAGQGGMQH